MKALNEPLERELAAVRGESSPAYVVLGELVSLSDFHSLRDRARALGDESLVARTEAEIDCREEREHEEAEADLRLHELGIEDHQAVPGATVRRQRHDACAHRALRRSLPAVVRRRGDRRLCGGRPRTRRTQRASRSSSSDGSDLADGESEPPGLRVGLANAGGRA